MPLLCMYPGLDFFPYARPLLLNTQKWFQLPGWLWVQRTPHPLPGFLLGLVISPTYHHPHVGHTSYRTDSGSPGLLAHLYHQSFTSSSGERGESTDWFHQKHLQSCHRVTWLSWTQEGEPAHSESTASFSPGSLCLDGFTETVVSMRSRLILKLL